jgi:lipoic acid synthetase
MSGYVRRPEWLKLSPLDPTVLGPMRRLTHDLELHTVCESARCPNRPDCFGRGTAAFMILGDTCTRHCTFCGVKKGRPQNLDPQEPKHIVQAISTLKLSYIVITSVTRDDLPDGGAAQFARTVRAIHDYNREIAVEVLVPDFGGSRSALETVLSAQPAVLNHNLETVPRLYPEVRPQAEYRRSLEVLSRGRLLNDNLLIKSGIMLGLGESQQEVIELMTDLREAGCDVLTIGQYLPPSRKHRELVRYVSPEEFVEYEDIGKDMGFVSVFSGPLVRSSFHAAESYLLATRNYGTEHTYGNSRLP